MKIKRNLISLLLLCFATFFITFLFLNNAHAESIRPIVKGDYDSYVTGLQNNDDGYKDPDDVNAPGATVHVQNANQFLDDIGYEKSSVLNVKSYNDPVSKIHKIILDNDISLADANDYNWFSKNKDAAKYMGDKVALLVKHKNLVIDGQGHTLDMLYNCFDNGYGSITNLTFENMKLLGSSYWGPVSIGTNVNINYRNIDYYGAQLIWSNQYYNVKVNIYGKVACHSLPIYKPLENNGFVYKKGFYGLPSDFQGYLTQGYGNQQNMQVGDIEFHSNSYFYGETYNGNCLDLSGSAVIDNNANVELHPHGGSSESPPIGYGSSGLYLNTNALNKASLIFGSNDNFNIYCDSGDVYNSDASHYAPDSPDKLSVGFFAKYATEARLDNGTNSKLRIISKGSPIYNKPLVNIQSMNAYVSGKGNSFDVFSDADNKYVPNDGVMNTSDSNIQVTDGGSFNMNIKNIPNSNQDNYLLKSPRSFINIDRPGQVVLSNDSYEKDQKNHLNYMTSGPSSAFTGHNFINIKNSSVSAQTYDADTSDKIVNLNNVLSKDIVLPLDGTKLLVAGIRLMGSYFEMLQYANGVNNTLSNDGLLPVARNFNTVTIKGTPIPEIYKINHKNVNTHNRNVSGQLTDDNGKPISNAYIKLKLDGEKNFVLPKDTDDENEKFYKSNDNFINYINSQEMVYNVLRQYVPDRLGLPGGPNIIDILQRPNFYSSIAGGTITTNGKVNSYNVINSQMQPKYFGYANQYFMKNYDQDAFRQFNIGTTTYDKNGNNYSDDPYVAMTDSNGNFTFTVPQSVFDKIQNKKDGVSYLDIVPSYNFTDGPTKKINVSYNPLIEIHNKIKNISYPDSDSSDGLSLKNVFQGGQGRGPEGDTLEFDDEFDNYADNSDISGSTLSQEVPDSVDDSSIKISYDNGKTFEPLNSNVSVTKNDNRTKSVKINNVDLKSGQKLNLVIRATMKINHDDVVDNSDLNVKPTIVYNGVSDDGNANTISFTDNALKFKPNDIYFGDAKINKNQLISPTDNNQPIITDFKDNRRDKAVANIYVQQESDNFYKDDDSSQGFSGNLILGGNVLSVPTLMFSTDGSNDIYLNNSKSLYLLPNEDCNTPGNYSTKLDWTVNYGLN
ncbi:hypothetical protein [Apilactobacillus xinyiensis]|uniref:hypothetical protein n=1 Tax=Apilactobacillus xinyiensis TaxID=2841032 RepID=UPI00200FDFCE|nr:hypothetical protein [Apilactobacillus xinyiensis]MCL0318949.1 hypothetical protein [Apilactobacillus xinyiensis]